jgi:hypothetical protein
MTMRRDVKFDFVGGEPNIAKESGGDAFQLVE